MAVIRMHSMEHRSRRFSQWWSGLRSIVAMGLLVSMASAVQANTIVRVSTNYGDFSLELFDTATPATVQNFLNYVNRGAYNQTYFHRLERTEAQPGVLQGGGYSFVRDYGPVPVPADAPVVNEYGIPNTVGTIAMAKFAGNPNSATTQWYINLTDNSEILNQANNGGFTVFGTVLGNGLSVMEAISALSTYPLGTTHTSTPLHSYPNADNGPLRAGNFVTINAEVVQRYSASLSVFEYQSGILMTSVDGGETLGAYSLNLSLVPDRTDIVFRLNPDSMIPLEIRPIGMATFASNTLRIPNLELNNNGSLTTITNVVLRLSNAETWEFTLESYDQQ